MYATIEWIAGWSRNFLYRESRVSATICRNPLKAGFEQIPAFPVVLIGTSAIPQQGEVCGPWSAAGGSRCTGILVFVGTHCLRISWCALQLSASMRVMATNHDAVICVWSSSCALLAALTVLAAFCLFASHVAVFQRVRVLATESSSIATALLQRFTSCLGDRPRPAL
jgi:hypothetical protein